MDKTEIEKLYLDKFTRYVKIPTASDSKNIDEQPSTKEQFELAKLLVDEMKQLGVEDVELSQHCYVYGYVNKKNTNSRIVLLAHMDVSEDAPSIDVKPQVHVYEGGSIKLETGIEIPEKQLQDVRKGSKIVTSDGTTLLGGDDKSGIAIIMTLIQKLQVTDDLPSICICFTPDEEIGNGVGHINMEKLTSGIKNAYGITVDGSRGPELTFETFTAYAFKISIEGYNIHPGYAFNKMQNSITYACKLANTIQQTFKQPENSKETEPYILINEIQGEVGVSVLEGIIRSFKDDEIQQLIQQLKQTVDDFSKQNEQVKTNIDIKFQYYNMRKYIPDKLVDMMMNVGNEFKTYYKPIRGGTDGSRLSEMGLPTPDIWNGAVNFHSVKEFVVVDDAVDAVLYLHKLLQYKE